MITYQNTSKILKQGLEFLKEFGYGNPTEEVEQDVLAGDSVTLTYKAKEIGIEIGISYWQAQLGSPESFVVLVDNGQDRIGLNEWLKDRGKENALTLWNNLGIPEELFIMEFISSFESLCRGNLLDIIKGRRWDSVHINFMGFK